MNGEDLFKGLVNIDDKYIVEAIKNKKVIKSNRKTGTLVACFLFIIIYLTILESNLNKPLSVNLETTIVNEEEEAEGVYIPKIELTLNDSLDSKYAFYDMIGAVVYNGNVYTQAEYIECNDEEKTKYVNEFLGTASNTITEGNTSYNEFDDELESNVPGDVYSVNGYSEDFRICIPKMHENSTFIAFFENLNGITLYYGRDLYGEERLNLKDNYKSIFYQSNFDWLFSLNNYNNISDVIQNEEIDDFVDALYEAPFVEVNVENEKEYLEFYENKERLHLYFKMNDESTVEISLFEGGFVRYDNSVSGIVGCLVKIDNPIFEKVFEACK